VFFIAGRFKIFIVAHQYFAFFYGLYSIVVGYAAEQSLRTAVNIVLKGETYAIFFPVYHRVASEYTTADVEEEIGIAAMPDDVIGLPMRSIVSYSALKLVLPLLIVNSGLNMLNG
jgi:hypothetical protein